MFRKLLLASAALLVVALSIGSAFAQTSATEGAPSSMSPAIEEVAVTATRRSVNLQEVPGTIEAVSSSTLEALNIKGTDALGQLVPGLSVNRSGGVSPFIRGLGTNNSGFTGNPAPIHGATSTTI